MNYIKVWCEYDISGSFGGNNNEEVYAVPDDMSNEQIDKILKDKFQFLVDEVECETDLFDEGLMGWEYVDVELLG